MTASVTQPTIGLTPDQVAARRQGIGGSDAAAVIGADPYKTALDIYQVKVGERQPDAPNAAMKRGIFLEPIARRLYRELTGRRVRRLKQVTHASYPFMLCNVDGQIVGKHEHVGPGVLELKCPGVWAFAKAKREGLPLHWIVQMQHNLAVTGYTWGSFALFNADLWELIHFDVLVDLELVHALIVKEQQFWHQHIEKRVPPPERVDATPQLAEQLAKAQEAIGGGELLLRNDAEWVDAARVYLEAKEILETGEHLKATATERLKQAMGAKGAVEGAGIRAYWSEREGRVTFDRKALERAQPLDRALTLTALADAAEQRGLSSADTLWISEALKQAGLDLTLFEKRGKPFEDFRVYPVKAGVGD